MIKWSKKIYIKSNGTRKVSINIKPSGFLAWLKFFMFRQDYHGMLKTIQLVSNSGTIIPMVARKDELRLKRYEVEGFFEVSKNSEYSLEFELIDEANQWVLNYKMSMISN